MKVIVILDDHQGMMFHHRRLSQDHILINNIIELAKGSLWMNEYSSSLFQNQNNIHPQFLKLAAQDEYCFVEDQDLTPYLDKIQEFVIYHWNRHYPADVFFDVDLSSFQKIEMIEFVGSSHDLITRERLRRINHEKA